MNTPLISLSRRVTALSRTQKYAILLSVDGLLIPLSAVLAAWIWYPPLLTHALGFAALVALMTGAGLAFSIALSLPRIKLNTYETIGMQRTAAYAILVGLVGALGMRLILYGVASQSFVVIFTMLLILLSVTTRMVMRNILIWFYQRGTTRQRILIYGAGQTGVQLAAALGFDDAVEPVAFLDDNPTLRKVMVAGLPVYAPARVTKLVETLRIDRVVLAMPSISRPKQARLVRDLAEIGCEVSTLPGSGSRTPYAPSRPARSFSRSWLRRLSSSCRAVARSTGARWLA